MQTSLDIHSTAGIRTKGTGQEAHLSCPAKTCITRVPVVVTDDAPLISIRYVHVLLPDRLISRPAYVPYRTLLSRPLPMSHSAAEGAGAGNGGVVRVKGVIGREGVCEETSNPVAEGAGRGGVFWEGKERLGLA